MSRYTHLIAGRALMLLLALFLMGMLPVGAIADGPAAVRVYVDTSAIDARTDMSAAEKSAVKTAMMNEIKSNLESAFGTGGVEVTNDPEQRASSARSVTVSGATGQSTDGDGNTDYYWGEWEHGSSSTTVYLGTYMDQFGSSFKSGDPPTWDTAKLGKALGTTAAHELAHSYSAGHDDRPAGPGVTQPNKMNAANTPGQIGGGLPLNQSAKTTLTNNRGKAPCSTVTNYSTVAVLADWWSDPFTMAADALMHEPYAVTALFGFHGPLSNMFDLGWWGVDTDDGLLDGNYWGDFVYKSSMSGTTLDSPTITMFDGWTAHFVLRGRSGTPFEGNFYEVEPADLIVDQFVVRPDGELIGKHLLMNWDVNGDGIHDVYVDLTTNHPLGGEMNGFRLGVPNPLTVSEAKSRVDGTYVSIANVVVSRVFTDYLYVQSTGRSSGVRVQMPEGLPVPPHIQSGDRVSVQGKLGVSDDQERVLRVRDPMSLMPLGPGTVRPVGMINRAVGGSDFRYVPGIWSSGQTGVRGGIGLNNIGLLAKVWGRMKWQDPAAGLFGIDDGYDKILTCKLIEGDIPPFPDPMPYVMVTGIVSLSREGDSLEPRILISGPEDLMLIVAE